MPRKTQIPCALTIAGSDSGGGAGIQADLKMFASLGVHGASVVTCVTAQNPRRVLNVQGLRPALVRAQLDAIFEELPPRAVKTGMLYSSEIIRVIAEFFQENRRSPLILDPVMVATSGAVLLKPSAIRLLWEKLLPLATLVTPNLAEAEVLTGRKLKSIEDLAEAARAIHSHFGCAALVKGGHLNDRREAVDVFYDGRGLKLLRSPRVRGIVTHGTGCTYSAAIAAELALDHSLSSAVTRAKRHITRAIAKSYRVGAHWVLNP